MKTLDRVNEVFRNVFEDDELVVDAGTTASDVEGWDSLMHVTLIVALEKAFSVKFKSSEVAALENVGELVTLIERRTSP